MSGYLASEKNQLDMRIRNQMNLLHKNGYILHCSQHRDLKLKKDRKCFTKKIVPVFASSLRLSGNKRFLSSVSSSFQPVNIPKIIIMNINFQVIIEKDYILGEGIPLECG